jgi:hypothetical protein
VWSILLLAAVVAVLLHQALFTARGLVPADGVLSALPWARVVNTPPSNRLLADQYATFLPVRQFLHDEFRRGHFPLWNPHLAAGMPSVASMQIAAFYPINLLLLPVGPFIAAGYAAFAKLLLAGFFTMLYMRQQGIAAPAALASGLVYTLSGFMIVWLGHPHVNAAVVLPLLLYFVDRQVSNVSGSKAWVGLALAYAATLLGGHPPTTVHITLVVACYIAFRLFQARREVRLHHAALCLVAVAAGVLVAAPQLLPYAEYYRESSSPLSTEALGRWASHLTPGTLAHFLMPYLAGSPQAGFEHLEAALGLGPIDNFNERTGYIGVLPLFLAAVALFRCWRRSPVVVFHAGAVAVSLLIVYGVPPWPAVMHGLPILNGINHQRLLLVVDFGAAVLSGFGLDALMRSDARGTHRRLAIGFACAVAVALAGLWNVVGPGLALLDAAARAFLMGQVWILAGGVTVAVVMTIRQLPSRAAGALAVAWIALDLLLFGMGYNPAIPQDKYYPTTDGIRRLQDDPSRFRILGLGPVLPPNTAAVYGLDDVRGQDFMTIRRYEELITGRAGEFSFYGGTADLPPSFPLLNVKYVLVPDRLPAAPAGFELTYDREIAIYRNAHVANRALVVFHCEVERNPTTILDRVRSGSFDATETLLLEEEPERRAVSVDPGIPAGEATITAYEPDRVLVEARLPRPGFLVLQDTYYPGWRAFADGRELPILRANYAFRSVALPAGTTRVEFRYQPLSFRAGVLLSIVTSGLLAIGCVARRKA